MVKKSSLLKSNKKKGLLEGKSKLTKEELKKSTNIVYSFKDFDKNQKQTFEKWQEIKLLAPMLDRFQFYSQHTFESAASKKFKTYKDFPHNSKFKHPDHVIEDAAWTSMHVQGKQCVIGHRIQNIFYVVFLDCEHEFYPSTKK